MSRLRMALVTSLSLLAAAVVASYLIAHLSLDQLLTILSQISHPLLTIFCCLSLLGTTLRMLRYRLLLKVRGHSVPRGPLFLIVLVRNMCADLLPAQAGSAIYIPLANRTLGVPAAMASAHFALVLLFDLLVLAPFLLLAILLSADVASPSLAIGLVLAYGVAVTLLLRYLSTLVATVTTYLPWRRLKSFCAALSEELRLIPRGADLFSLFALTLGVRALKYCSLYVLLCALLLPQGYAAPSFVTVFLGIAGAELSSSLPFSGVAGFGTYQGAWILTFRLLGFPPELAALTSVSHHLLTQLWGYGLGASALIALLRNKYRLGGAASYASH